MLTGECLLFTVQRGDAMLAQYMLMSCVRRSVHLSHAGIVPTLLNLGLRKVRKQCRKIAQDFGFVMPKI